HAAGLRRARQRGQRGVEPRGDRSGITCGNAPLLAAIARLPDRRKQQAAGFFGRKLEGGRRRLLLLLVVMMPRPHAVAAREQRRETKQDRQGPKKARGVQTSVNILTQSAARQQDRK